ncbi:MAG: hypothetical protein ACRD21_24165, partial [Vicinamibacteria bacterium]
LYQVPLGDFVRARNDLAAALKKSGDGAAAERVKEISKPSASAWAVNQLYWKDRPAFEKLLDAGDRYRMAQRATLSGEGAAGPGAAEAERRERLAEALGRVREILSEDQKTAGPQVLDRIATTLEALASYGNDNPTPMKGRLSDDVESPGFGALASLAPVIPFPTPGKKPQEERSRAAKKLAEEKAALAKAIERERVANEELDRARSRLTQAQDSVARAELEVGRAAAEQIEMEAAVEEAKLRLEELESG